MKLMSHSGKTLQAILLVLGCVAVLFASLFLARLLNPGASAQRAKASDEMYALARDAEVKSSEMWERFSNLREVKEKLDAEDVKLLEETIALREKYVAFTAVEDSKFELMREQWHLIKADECRRKSEAAEAQGDAASAKNDFTAAAESYASALQWERAINEQFPLSKRVSIARMAALDYRFRNAQARPIQASSVLLENEGDALVEKKDWTGAAQKYAEALEGEMLLREKYRNVSNLEYSRPIRLQIKVETAQSAPENAEILDQIAAAARLAKEGKTSEAEKQWNAALARYDKLAGCFPQSEYTQKKAIEALCSARDHALVVPVASEFARDVIALDATIRAIRSEDQVRVGDQALRLLQEADRIQKKYPAAAAAVCDATTRAKLQYLSTKARDITLIQGRLLALLKPLPGDSRRRLMYSEVPQVLYVAIMDNKNPSAVRGDNFPVESVTYHDALIFCQRLGWLIGRTVRLPSQSEYRQALGDLPSDPDALLTQVWAIENSNGIVHATATTKPNQHGFYDLLGNVSEWLFASDGSTAAEEIGGNCQTGVGALATIPSNPVSKQDKSRLRGFRVLVEEPAK
jgi:hypothetical protein